MKGDENTKKLFIIHFPIFGKIQRNGNVFTVFAVSLLLVFSMFAFGFISLFPQNTESLSFEELHKKFKIVEINSLSLGFSSQGSSFSANLLQNSSHVPIKSEVIIQKTSGDILLLGSILADKTDEMVDAYGKVSGVEFVEKNISGVFFSIQDPFRNVVPYSEDNNNTEQKEVSSPIVALLDSGVDTHHPRIPFAWENTIEKYGHKGVDDDGNGFVDDFGGWNFIDNSSDISDNQGHGTHLAGIITGMSSVSRPQIMPLKISKNGKKVFLSHVLMALEYAKEKKVNIVNMSFGFSEPSSVLHDLLEDMSEEGIFLVSAAGNSGSRSHYYPAGYKEVFAVGSSNMVGEKRYVSNYGSWVDSFFPATYFSTLPNGMGGKMTGTSQSAAFASSLAAFLLSQHPNMSLIELQKNIQEYSQKFSENFKRYFQKIPTYAQRRFLTYSEMGFLLLQTFGEKNEVWGVLQDEYMRLLPLVPSSEQVFHLLTRKMPTRFVRSYDAHRILRSLHTPVFEKESLHSSPNNQDRGYMDRTEFIHSLSLVRK